MKGTWKENLGGWNHKDTRRKRQNRNHTLNDNGRILNNKHKYHAESEVEILAPEPIYKYGEHIKVYSVEVSRDCGWMWSSYEDSRYKEYINSYSVRTAWYYDGVWYDEYSNEPIDGHVKELAYLYTDFMEFEEPKVVNSREIRWHKISRSCWRCTNTLKFFYDKPVPKWKVNSWYKYISWSLESKIINVPKGRREIKTWIKKGDYDAPFFSKKY